MDAAVIERHRAAIHRTVLGRPLRLALDAGAVPEGCDVFDYGCGYGDDVARLKELGFRAAGWDPYYAPGMDRSEATVCYLGFVLNVIERPQERLEVLRTAWSLAKSVLVVGALVSVDARGIGAAMPFGDGVVTRIGTFQKYFEQRELENLLRSTLDAEPVALGMGAFAVFRDPEQAARLLARRVVRRVTGPSDEQLAILLSERRSALRPLTAFYMERGRWPDSAESKAFTDILRGVGSLARVTAAIERDAAGAGIDFEDRRRQVREDLELVVALGRFRNPEASPAWDPSLRHELTRHFGSLREAVAAGDRLLRSLGDARALRRAAASAPVGKRMPDALYVHDSARETLPTPLRLYEELGRAYVGGIEGANIIKLHLDHPAISYLSYPDFDSEAHPALDRTFHIDLQTFRMHIQRFEKNPPILHRKELFVGANYPAHAKFARLTRQEEAWDLFDGSTGSIGNRDQWANRLRVAGVRIAGHRLFRAKG
jgi:DNA phosphorothioation-associated putative methyltransferase